MDAAQVAEIRRKCISRVLARRRPPAETVTEVVRDGVTITEAVAEFSGPADIGEWIDSMGVSYYQPRGPWIGCLVSVLEAGRVSEAGAVAALDGARKLRPWDAWRMFADLESLRAQARLPAARRLMTAVLDAWTRHRLAEERPGFPELGDMPRPKPAPQPDPKLMTRWGLPAGSRA